MEFRATLFVLGAVTLAFAVMVAFDPYPQRQQGQVIYNRTAGMCGNARCDGTCVHTYAGPECLADVPAYLTVQDTSVGDPELLVACTGPATQPIRCWAAPGVVMVQERWWVTGAYRPPERESILWGAP